MIAMRAGQILSSLVYIWPYSNYHSEDLPEVGTFQAEFSKRRISRFWKENDCPANDILARETALRVGHHVFLRARKNVAASGEAQGSAGMVSRGGAR